MKAQENIQPRAIKEMVRIEDAIQLEKNKPMNNSKRNQTSQI